MQLTGLASLRFQIDCLDAAASPLRSRNLLYSRPGASTSCESQLVGAPGLTSRKFLRPNGLAAASKQSI